LDAGSASQTDLGARLSRIGGRMQAILQFERALMLPRLDDAALRRTAEAQVEDLLQHIEQLAAPRADQEAASAAETLALSAHFDAHLQLLTERVWNALHTQDRLPLAAE